MLKRACDKSVCYRGCCICAGSPKKHQIPSNFEEIHVFGFPEKTSESPPRGRHDSSSLNLGGWVMDSNGP